MDLAQLKYPIGEFVPPENLDVDIMNGWIQEIRTFPELIRKEVTGLSEVELNCRYRPEGWKIRQVVHHCADSHMNALNRVKWVLTEDEPTIKPYYEARWAELPDTLDLDPVISLNMLDSIHLKLTHLLRHMSEEEWNKVFYHPEVEGPLRIGYYAGMYAWHGNHHLTHIRQALTHKFT